MPLSAVLACSQAQQLARLGSGGRAWAVVAWAETLEREPLAAFSRAAGRRRTLLWSGDEWLLAIGAAARFATSRAGRTVLAAMEATRIESRCAVAAAAGAPALPLLLTTLAFEDEPQADTHWGRSLPGATLVLPRRLQWRRRDGSGWVIAALAIDAGESATAEQLAQRLLAEPEPEPVSPPVAWPAIAGGFTDLVEDVTGLIRDGAMRKVVLARAIDVTMTTARPEQVLDRLWTLADHASWLYAVDLDDGGCFLGATPEMLFAAEGNRVEALALGGSRARVDGEDAADAKALLDATKERKEHQLVVEHLVSVLQPRCAPFTLPAAPHVRALPRILHLETVIRAELREPNYLELLAALHPTPAICGLPTVTAANYIRRHEHLARGLYAGVIGWSTPTSCRFVVPLRGGIIHDGRSRLFAGAGVVETSDPQAELAETDLKLRLMRQALGVAAPTARHDASSVRRPASGA